MESKTIINSNQIVKIWITPAIPVNDLTPLWEGIGHWEYKEYKTVKRFLRKPIEAYAPGWYRTPTFSYDCKKKYIQTDEELMVFLKKRYSNKYKIQDKILYRCVRVIMYYSNGTRDELYFNTDSECDNFLNELYSITSTLKDITKYDN